MKQKAYDYELFKYKKHLRNKQLVEQGIVKIIPKASSLLYVYVKDVLVYIYLYSEPRYILNDVLSAVFGTVAILNCTTTVKRLPCNKDLKEWLEAAPNRMFRFSETSANAYMKHFYAAKDEYTCIPSTTQVREGNGPWHTFELGDKND